MIPKARLRLISPRRIGAGAVLDCAWLAAVHVGTVVAFTRGGTGRLVALAAALYGVRMLAVGAGYHRYFAHRAYRTSRGAQLVLAVLGTTAVQKGPLWWASQHRHHHRAPDGERDGQGPLRRALGTRRYANRDPSRNNALVSLVTLGEGWHNNHHHTMNSARHGFSWWEIDVTYALLVLLAKVGLVWGLRGVPAHAWCRNLVSAVSGPRSSLAPGTRAAAHPG